MKIKTDFVTNSSSTNYIISEEYSSGDPYSPVDQNFTYLNFKNITNNFINTVESILPTRNFSELNIHSIKEDDVIICLFGSVEKLEFESAVFSNYNFIFKLDRFLSFYSTYTTFQNIIDVEFAMNRLVSKFFKKVFSVENISLLMHSRKVTDFSGDGWNSGDPCFGHYGETSICQEAVNILEKSSLHKGEFIRK